MRQLKIKSIGLLEHWGFLLTQKNISQPEPKDYIVEVPGRNGSVDLTESMGGVRYGDREVEFVLLPIEGDYSQRMKNYYELVRFIHGKVNDIEEPDRPGEILRGRWKVGEPSKINGDLFSFKLFSKNVYPYYISVPPHEITYNLNSGDTHNISVDYNGVGTVWPLVKFTGNGTITAEGDNINYNLTSSYTRYDHIRLNKTVNNFKIQGNGDLTFLYSNESL